MIRSKAPQRVHLVVRASDKTTRCGRKPDSIMTTRTKANATCRQCIEPNTPFNSDWTVRR